MPRKLFFGFRHVHLIFFSTLTGEERQACNGWGTGKNKILIPDVHSVLLQPQRLGEGRDDAAKIVFFLISAHPLDVIFDTREFSGFDTSAEQVI